MKLQTAQLTTRCSRCGSKIYAGEMMLVEHHTRWWEDEHWCEECAQELAGEE